jgi:1-aminocyclopropane-1-carboxylate deaminase/D-cysteine desulfhydrase-like pyridoxal-dependent ACC family enzyme
MNARGVRVVGYYETSVSMATWGVSYFCNVLEMKPVIFYYKYKDGLHNNQEKQQVIWNRFGAEIIINEKPNMQKLHEAVSRKEFEKLYPTGEFLPAGLKFDYTVEEVAKQVHLVPPEALGGTIVICCGSGMMTAGVLTGLSELGISQDVIGVIVHPKSKENLKKFVISKSYLDPFHRMNFNIVEYGYEYTEQEKCEVPFPCCPYYDRKAYKWMIDNYDKLKQPVLFWNIGSSYTYYNKEDLLK